MKIYYQRILGSLLCLLVSSASFANIGDELFVNNEAGINIKYIITKEADATSNGEVQVVNSNSLSGQTDIILPETISGNSKNYNVTGLGNAAFKNNCTSLKYVELPSTMKEIGNEAFYGCSGLKKITSRSTTPPTCGNGCFYGVDKSIQICVPFRGISSYQLADGWKDFANINIPEDEIWYHTLGKDKIHFDPSLNFGPDNYIHSNELNGTAYIHFDGPVTQIPANLFYEKNDLWAIYLPYTIGTIGAYSFSLTSLTEISIPDNVTLVDSFAFAGCSALEKVDMPRSLTNLKSNAFLYCSSLSTITLYDKVTNIGNGAFNVCSGLTSIRCEAKVPPTCGNDCFSGVDKSIPLYVPAEAIEAYKVANGWKDFLNIKPLTPDNEIWYTTYDGNMFNINSAIAPDNSILSHEFKNGYWVISFESPVTQINDEVFSFGNLKSIILPSRITMIGESAFLGSDNLKNVYLPSDLETIDNYAFAECSIGNINLPSKLKSIGEEAFSWNEISKLVLPEGLETIGSEAFAGNFILDSIVIPSSVSSIGDGIFSGCFSLKSIKVNPDNECFDSNGNSNAIIASNSHVLKQGCKNTVIPSDVVEIGNGAFAGMVYLSEINIPEGLTSIGEYAFSGAGFTSIALPEGLSNIGKDAFVGSSLKSITIPSTITQINEETFANCENLRKISFSEGLDSIGKMAFAYCTKLDTVIIPEGTRVVGFGAFSEDKAIKVLSLPSTLKRIGYQAFYYCVNLKNVVLPDSLTEVEGKAFYYCPNTTIVAKSKTPFKVDDTSFENTKNVYYPRYGSYADAHWQSAKNKGKKYVSLVLDQADNYSIDQFALVDSWKEYYVPFTDLRDVELYNNVTYTRNFKNHEWQPLYLPVDFPYSALSSKFDVAKVCNTQTDEYDLAVTEVTSGTLTANTPYFVRLKNTVSTGNHTITSASKIAITETIENEYETEFYTIGTNYTRLSGKDIQGKYGLVNGWFKLAGAQASLPLFRIYLDKVAQEGNAVKLMFVLDEDDTSISNINKKQTNRTTRYNLSGQAVGDNYKGIVIENGKKMLNK